MAAHGKDFKVVIIDKYHSYISTYTSIYQHLSHKCPQTYRFVSRLAEDRLSVEIGQKEFPLIVEGYDKPITSRNGKLMMCISGFKNAVVNHSEAIRKHLCI